MRLNSSTSDQILARFRAALARIYGERLVRIVLFGARAHGTARPGAQYDVAVFLHRIEDRWAEFDRMRPVVTAILDSSGAFILALPYSEAQYRDQTPLMRQIRQHGIEIGEPDDAPEALNPANPTTE